MEQLQTLWQRAKENSGSDEGFQLLKDAFSPNKQYLLSIVSEIQQFPHYVKPLVVYLSENFPDYEVLGQLLTNVVDSDRNEVTGDLIRELFEMAVEAVGLDIFTGISIWQKYAEFELDNFEDYLAHLKEDSSMDLRSLNKAKQNITKVYLRQLSLPLVGNDSALTQFQEILSQYYSESDIDIIQPTTLETNFLGASKMLEERLPFEMKIYDEGYRSLTKSEQLMIWEEYITFELRQNKVDRLNRLYERLLLQFSEDVEIWLAYCGCTLCFQHDFLLTTKVVKRGLMVHYYDLLLRRTLLLSINFRQIRLLESGLIHSKEQANVEINSLRANFVETLAVGFSQAEEYLDFYFTFINCTRRLLCQMMIAKNNCALDALLFVKDEFMSSISELQQFLLNYYPQWKLAWETLAFYQSHQIYSIISPLEKHLRTSEEFPRAEIWTKTSFECNYELWHFSLQQNFSDYTSYQYFINQLINIKDYNSVSYVYRQLYADRTRQIMDKKSIVKDWMKFEENYRDMNEFTATLAKFFPKISDICSKSIPSVILTSNLKDVNVKEKKGSRKRDRIGESEEDDEGKVSKTKRYKVQFQTEIKNESKIEEEKLNAFVPSTVQGDAGFKDIKTNIVCIKNFPYAAPANKIYDFIRSILPYQRIEMIFTKAGNSRGMVNVEYKDSSEIVKLLSLKDLLVYEERPLEIECNVPSLLNFDPQIFCTIFVNHLPQEFSEEQLIDYFSSCGAVSKIKLAKDKKSELKKGSALILFDSVESRNKALLLNKSSFLGQEITVLPSKFAIVETNAASDSLLTEIVDIPKSNPRSNLVTSFAPRSVRRKKIQTEN